MKKILSTVLMVVGFAINAQESIKPALAPVKVVTNQYHGITLEDPYQYMEDLSNPEVVSWMKENANYASSVLNSISGKKVLFDKMMELIDRRASSVNGLKITKSNVYYYLKRVPGEEIAKMYKRNGYEGEESLFFDPETYKEGTDETYAIQSISPNIQGDKIAVTVAANGSENPETLIFTENGERFPEILHLASGISWLKSGKEFYYNKLNSPDVTDMNRGVFTKVYIHKMETEQEADALVFSSELHPEVPIESEEYPIVIYSEESNLDLLLISSVDNSLEVFYKEPQSDSNTKWKILMERINNVVNFDVDNKYIYFLSFKDASNYKILKASLKAPAFSNAKTIVSESKSEMITDLEVTKDGLYYAVMKNGVEANVYFLPNNKKVPVKLQLPFAAGQVDLESKNSESSEIWISISGWTSPSKRFLYHPATNTFTHQQLSTPVEYPELDNLIAKEVMVRSHDGVMVPVSIIHKKNIEMDGQNPTVIYTYGAYGSSTNPFFSPITLAYTLYNGVLVVPHVRGGGELGEAWHRAGQKETKPNTWKDGIATAEYLINEGYTIPSKLSIFGGSAGGIFVGRAITERPDLFVAGAPMVGAMNTVRMEETPNGPVNTPEFGTVKDPEEFKGLLEMDSYHHIEPDTEYPAMLITAGINDPRVIAWQPAKFAAKLQAANTSDKPILFLTNFEGGHGGGTKLTDTINELAGMFAFFYWQSGHPNFQLAKPDED
ncbi:prolyl oligopeptidase family serine peptidase [Mariniflexile gromovii]|uniref:prolyl oligopeptidase n=1 Tax=Mariniflexile gromovii TaxID=362523 RepID=A0ABS4BXT0_9FLAO|nr:prolyl oligopeptidase family serine peptidase [Mariniflexile gromovii]MBP0905391.1 S9 family peptidase [Mariniflexile gromovii]